MFDFHRVGYHPTRSLQYSYKFVWPCQTSNLDPLDSTLNPGTYLTKWSKQLQGSRGPPRRTVGKFQKNWKLSLEEVKKEEKKENRLFSFCRFREMIDDGISPLVFFVCVSSSSLFLLINT